MPDTTESNGTNSATELSRLIEISGKLEELNETLRKELSDSRKNSEDLQTMLEQSRQALNELKTELSVLVNSSETLRMNAEKSRQESEELRTALMKAESSLLNLETSFEAYRLKAEQETASLKRSASFWQKAFIAAAVMTASSWTFMLLQ